MCSSELGIAAYSDTCLILSKIISLKIESVLVFFSHADPEEIEYELSSIKASNIQPHIGSTISNKDLKWVFSTKIIDWKSSFESF